MTLRVGVIGLGVGEQHVLAYERTAGCRVAAVADLSHEKLSALRGRLPGVRTTRDADELLADPELDAVSIASYDDAHFAQVVAALRAGKHVFVEKPLCRTVDELTAVKREWTERPQLALASNLVLRAAPM